MQLLGWVRHLDHVEVIALPVPPAPHPYLLTTLHVPALGAYLSAVRGDLNAAYPDEFGVLHRDEQGTPSSLTLLGMDWVVLAQVAHQPACEIAFAQPSDAIARAATAALNALEAYHHD